MSIVQPVRHHEFVALVEIEFYHSYPCVHVEIAVRDELVAELRAVYRQ